MGNMFESIHIVGQMIIEDLQGAGFDNKFDEQCWIIHDRNTNVPIWFTFMVYINYNSGEYDII